MMAGLHKSAGIVATVLMLGGCLGGGPDVPPPASPPQDATCNAGNASWAIGQHATERLAETARIAADARTARVMRPGEPHTMEFNPHRLNLETDRGNIVREVRCG